jgi:hypothetical protein
VPFAVWIDAASALALSYSGRFADARDVARAARADADTSGSPSLRAFARYASAESLAHAGPARARELLEEALELAESVGAEWVTGLVHLSLATLTARNGAPRDALAHYLALLDRWRRAGTWTQQWNALRTLVAVLVDLNRHEEAARLLGGIEAYAPTPRWGDDDARLRSAELRMRRALGDARCQDLFADGGALAAIDVLAAAQQAVAVTLADHATDEFDVPPSSALA